MMNDIRHELALAIRRLAGDDGVALGDDWSDSVEANDAVSGRSRSLLKVAANAGGSVSDEEPVKLLNLSMKLS